MKKLLSLFLCFLMLVSFSGQALALDNETLDTVIKDTAVFIEEEVANPTISSIGGEWAIIGLARGGADVDEKYFENYYQTVVKQIKACEGVLHEKKYTEYSRVILALTAIGKNPSNVAGYNLLMPLGDYEKTIWQGVNGSIWALIALDSGDYEIPQNQNATIQANREMYIKHILENQTADGGWALSGDTAEIDMTAMALTALSKYQDNEEVKKATEKAISCMSEMQNADGGFSSKGVEAAESNAQVMVALCELGISFDDLRFVKNGNTVLDKLLKYYENGKGFKHTMDSTTNLMATEQCFYALVALKRFNENSNSLYDMNDAIAISENNADIGLTDKNADVKKADALENGKTFSDVLGHENQRAIEVLAERNIINGKSENYFEPNATMTRAEFATIVVKALSLPMKKADSFSDVKENDWYYDFVNTAYAYGIVSGVSENEFKPMATITREEASVMVTRAAKLCGNNTAMEENAVRDVLAGFTDYIKASDWSRSSLAFCFDNAILSDEVIEIKPKEAVTRAEIAQMLYNMLSLSMLI